MQITFTVAPEEAQAIINVLGQLPTSSGAFPLLQKLSAQAQAQLNPQPAPAAPQEKAND